jgi:phage FluMu protein Com
MNAGPLITAVTSLGIFSRKKAPEPPKENGNEAFIRCPACNKVLHSTIARCPYCSNFLEINCPNCDRITNRAYKNCPYCKYPLKNAK